MPQGKRGIAGIRNARITLLLLVSCASILVLSCWFSGYNCSTRAETTRIALAATNQTQGAALSDQTPVQVDAVTAACDLITRGQFREAAERVTQMDPAADARVPAVKEITERYEPDQPTATGGERNGLQGTVQDAGEAQSGGRSRQTSAGCQTGQRCGYAGDICCAGPQRAERRHGCPGGDCESGGVRRRDAEEIAAFGRLRDESHAKGHGLQRSAGRAGPLARCLHELLLLAPGDRPEQQELFDACRRVAGEGRHRRLVPG